VADQTRIGERRWGPAHSHSHAAGGRLGGAGVRRSSPSTPPPGRDEDELGRRRRHRESRRARESGAMGGVRDCVGVGVIGLLLQFYSVEASWAGLCAMCILGCLD
jgi:hypothetical protein